MPPHDSELCQKQLTCKAILIYLKLQVQLSVFPSSCVIFFITLTHIWFLIDFKVEMEANPRESFLKLQMRTPH